MQVHKTIERKIKMVTTHCINQIEKREINIDIEMIEHLCRKSNNVDSAFILGEKIFLDDDCWIILIVRHEVAITIELHRKSQALNETCLQIKQIVKFPCIF